MSMSAKTKKIILSVIAVCVLLVLAFLLPKAAARRKWQSAAQAAGGLPYQIGLTNVAIVNCVTSGVPPVCVGGVLCATLDAARCVGYSEVSGKPAGGMGNNALFLNAAIAKAGLKPGGQLIAGGMSPAAMDNGVLASAGGCFGCVAK